MTLFYRIASYILLCLNLLLVFLLLFESKVSLPLVMSPLGRLHPLILHTPIGLAAFLVILYYFRMELESKSYEKLNRFLLTITSLSLSLTALFGFFLSQEKGFDEDILSFHKWSGTAVSLFCYGLLLFYYRIKFYANSSGSWALLSIIAVAGHFGASITHGENYLFEAFKKENAKPVFTENNSLYEASVYPILEAKCISCHNDNKIKGELNMSTIQKIVKGGKNGPIWKAGDALKSHMILRANLPIEDKKHMPPRGKAQLSEADIVILTAWINEGADVKKAIKAYEANSKVKVLAMSNLGVKSSIETEKVYEFSAASDADILAVNNPYCVVSSIANNTPALQVDFFVTKKYDRKSLENLSKISKQIVNLNLSKMPIKDEDISLIAKFPNMEKLNLNQTEITGKTLELLKSCKNLNSIAISGNKVAKSDLEKLLTLPSIKEVFTWETQLQIADIQNLTKKYPKIKFENGYIPDPSELLKINPPILVNEELVLKGDAIITLKHNIKNVKIHYTLDGTEPDSTTTTIYTSPIKSSGSVSLKAIATKEGWYASRKISKFFFKATYTPDSVYLAFQPNQRYTGGGSKALFDLKKGLVDNTTSAWLGFRETDFNAIFEFKETKPISNITLSFLKNIGGYIMPPTQVEVWGGNTKNDLKRLQKKIPNQPQKGDLSEISGLDIGFTKGNYKYIKVVAKPVAKLPSWHPGKGQKGWVFVDEVFFN